MMKYPNMRAFRQVLWSGAFLLSVLPVPVLAATLDSLAAAPLALKLSKTLHSVPQAFEPSYKSGPGAQFLSRSADGTILLEPTRATVLGRRKGNQHFGVLQASGSEPTSRPFAQMMLLHSNSAATASAEESLISKTNYFLGNDPGKWRTNVPLFRKVRFSSVYNNIDLVYYGSHDQLEYDFIIRPGGEPQSIQFSLSGTQPPKIDKEGDLLFGDGKQRASLRQPVAYQIIDSTRHDVAVKFLALGRNRFGFRVGRYDHGSPLILDPVLAYSTYLGGSDDEGIFGIGFDEEGNIYVAGETSSIDFPQKGGVQNHVGGSYDAFVSKFDPQGANLIYSTYLGGSNYDHAIGMHVDEEGGVYIAGITQSPDFPVKNAWQPALAGTANGFVSRLDASGANLVFSAYLGGRSFDQVTALAVDHDHGVYVAGSTNSVDFPVTPNAFQKQCDGGANTGFCIGDAFVTKFGPNGRKPIYSTYLGGAHYDAASGIAVNNRGQVYVVGQAGSSDFPTKNAYQSSLSGPSDGFVTELNAAGSGLIFSTLLGGTNFDAASDVALDKHGNIYVTGITGSVDFPIAKAFQSTNSGGPYDAFITKLDPRGSQLIYSTYYGGSGSDYPFRIAITRQGDAAVIGFTSSTNFPTNRALYPSYSGGLTDAFVILLDRSGQRPRFSTYLGGTGDEYGYAIRVGCDDSIWTGGSTSSMDFPLAHPFHVAYGGGPFDAFLTRIGNFDDEDGDPNTASYEWRGEKGCTGTESN